jgi:hypothetical protein
LHFKPNISIFILIFTIFMPLALSRAEFIANADKFYTLLEENLDPKAQTFYDFEAQYVSYVQVFAKETLEQSISIVAENPRKKKKIQSSLGCIYVSSAHDYSKEVHGFRISPYLQGQMAYLGQNEIYEAGRELFQRFLGIETCAMQIHRVTNTHGRGAVAVVDEAVAMELSTELLASAVLYAQFDGSMIQMRDGVDWREVKVGRIFADQHSLTLSPKRKAIEKSLYVAHVGNKEGFLAKFEPLMDVFDPLGKRVVFLTDGAVWMRNWITENYPSATIILDFFHAVEHISAWLKVVEADAIVRQAALERYKKMLLEQGCAAVITAISAQKSRKVDGKKAHTLLLNYLNTNAFRMDYPLYLAQNLSIGSGAIESAQRTVVQTRLKLSGQRWTEEGAQNVLNLRCAHMSGCWETVLNSIKSYKNVA